MSARVAKGREERREEILDAALSLFAEKGYEGTSVSDIVRSLNVAQGTFYWYFKSKEEVFQEIARRYAEESMFAIEAIVRRDDLTAVEKIEELFLSFLVVDAPERQLLERIHTPAERALHDRIAREVMKRLQPYFISIVEQGVAEGVFTTRDPEKAAVYVMSLSAAQEFVDPAELNEDEIRRWLRSFFDFMSNGLGYTGEPLYESIERRRSGT